MSDDEALELAARTALLDHAAITAVGHLKDGGIRALLLKGPSIARWLYDEGERGYIDVDLLVSPRELDAAVQRLRSIGYVSVLDAAAPVERGEGWQNEETLRGPFGIEIDLHRRLIGVPSADRCWETLSARTAPFELGSETIDVLALEARTLHLALHAAQNGPRDKQALEDLRRGVRLLPDQLWRAAAELGVDLECTSALAGGLRLCPEGERLAARLGLPPVSDVNVAIRVRGASQDALFFVRLRGANGVRARLAIVYRELFPTAAFLRSTHPLASRGAAGLVIARVMRLLSIALRLPPALLTWLRARREVSRPNLPRRAR